MSYLIVAELAAKDVLHELNQNVTMMLFLEETEASCLDTEENQ